MALRYLFSGERRGLISIITMVAMLGVAVGVAALIVVMGVMDGAKTLLFARMSAIFPHVGIEAHVMPPQSPDPALMARLRGDPRVERAEPMIRKLAVVQSSRGLAADKEPVGVIGMTRPGKGSRFELGRELGSRRYDLARDEIMIGAPLAGKLGVKAGDKLFLVAMDLAQQSAGQPSVTMVPLKVREVFSTGFFEFDEAAAFMNEERLRQVYREGPGFDLIHVRLRDPMQSAAFRADLTLPPGYVSWDWSDPQHNGSFFWMLQLQKYLLFALLMLIVAVAAFNIIGTLILMVNEKTREVGILRAMGAGQWKVARIFLVDGTIVGVLGTLLGVVLGLVICALIPYLPLEMPASVYNFEKLPVEVRWGSVLSVVAAALGICTLASLLPARHAARLRPVEALRYD